MRSEDDDNGGENNLFIENVEETHIHSPPEGIGLDAVHLYGGHRDKVEGVTPSPGNEHEPDGSRRYHAHSK